LPAGRGVEEDDFGPVFNSKLEAQRWEFART
jgi:hypothetical protein